MKADTLVTGHYAIRKGGLNGSRLYKAKDKNILQAFLKVPREKFVQKEHVDHSYMDENLPINRDRFLINPLVQSKTYHVL